MLSWRKLLTSLFKLLIYMKQTFTMSSKLLSLHPQPLHRHNPRPWYRISTTPLPPVYLYIGSLSYTFFDPYIHCYTNMYIFLYIRLDASACYHTLSFWSVCLALFFWFTLQVGIYQPKGYMIYNIHMISNTYLSWLSFPTYFLEEEAMNLVTAWVPSEIAWTASSPGRIRHVEDWMSRALNVLALRISTSFFDSETIRPYMSTIMELNIELVFLDMPISGWICLRTLFVK